MSYYQNHHRRVITQTSLSAYIPCSPLGLILCSNVAYLLQELLPACKSHGRSKLRISYHARKRTQVMNQSAFLWTSCTTYHLCIHFTLIFHSLCTAQSKNGTLVLLADFHIAWKSFRNALESLRKQDGNASQNII